MFGCIYNKTIKIVSLVVWKDQAIDTKKNSLHMVWRSGDAGGSEEMRCVVEKVLPGL